jgi:2'-5' RNA ligase
MLCTALSESIACRTVKLRLGSRSETTVDGGKIFSKTKLAVALQACSRRIGLIDRRLFSPHTTVVAKKKRRKICHSEAVINHVMQR